MVLRTIASLVVMMVWLGAGAGSAYAGSLQAAKRVLNLQQVIDLAVKHSPEVREVQSRVAMSREDLAQVEAAYLPQLDLKALAGPVTDAREPLVVGNKIKDPSPGTSLKHLGVFGRIDFTVTQPVYTFGKLSNRKEAAEHGVAAQKCSLDKKKGEISLRAKQLYYALVLSLSGLDVADQADDYFDEARKRIAKLLKLDSVNVTESDLYRLDAYRAGVTRSRSEAEKGVKVAYFALKSMMGLPPGVDFEPADKSLSIADTSLPSLDKYIDKALRQRPEYKQLLEALEARKFMAMAAHSDRFPSLFVAMEGSVAGAPGRDKFDNPYIGDEFNHAHLGVVAGLKWNFDFGILKAEEAKRRAQYLKMLHSKESAELNIPIQVTEIYQQAKEWKAAAQAYHKAAQAARKWVISAITDFDMGVGTAMNMIDAIEKYGSNEGDYLQAVFKYHATLAQLAYATGTKDWREEARR